MRFIILRRRDREVEVIKNLSDNDMNDYSGPPLLFASRNQAKLWIIQHYPTQQDTCQIVQLQI